MFQRSFRLIPVVNYLQRVKYTLTEINVKIYFDYCKIYLNNIFTWELGGFGSGLDGLLLKVLLLDVYIDIQLIYCGLPDYYDQI